ncbi:MAG: hypothetical protein ACTJH9_11115 [Pseudoalteromonas sp.]
MSGLFKLKKLSLLISSSFLLFQGHAFADDDETNRKSMDTIIVTGEKVDKTLKDT